MKYALSFLTLFDFVPLALQAQYSGGYEDYKDNVQRGAIEDQQRQQQQSSSSGGGYSGGGRNLFGQIKDDAQVWKRGIRKMKAKKADKRARKAGEEKCGEDFKLMTPEQQKIILDLDEAIENDPNLTPSPPQ